MIRTQHCHLINEEVQGPEKSSNFSKNTEQDSTTIQWEWCWSEIWSQKIYVWILSLILTSIVAGYILFSKLNFVFVAHQASLSTEFPRQVYWSGLPFPSTGYLPNPVFIHGVAEEADMTQRLNNNNNALNSSAFSKGSWLDNWLCFPCARALSLPLRKMAMFGYI